MRTLKTQSECICGHTVAVTFKKPKPFQLTISRATCSGCGTRYLMSMSKKEIKFINAEVSDFAKENFASWREQL